MIRVGLPTGVATFWLGGDLPAGFSASRRASISVAAEGPAVAATVAVEWLVFCGPRTLYGLLGGTARPTDRQELTVTAHFSEGRGRSYRSSSRDFEFDELQIGLPLQYRGGIEQGVAWVREIWPRESIPRAELTVDYAVHGALGSCDLMFAGLVVTLVRLLGCLSRSATVGAQELLELVREPPDRMLRRRETG